MQNIEITFGDFLAGGGGVTEAASQIPGVKALWVLNHDKTAIRTNLFHHNKVKHFWADIYKQDEHEMEPVDFAWASIECTQHSQAKGGGEKNIGSYMLGWELVRYMKHIQPLVLGIENVPEFKKWAPLKNGKPDKKRLGQEFTRWKNTICALGYDYHELICNAADYGIPTRRVRYFAFFVNKSLNIDQIPWPAQTHSKTGANGLKKWEPCKPFINTHDEGVSIFGRQFNPLVLKGKRKPLVHKTLLRIAGGIKKLAPELSFIFQYYGSGLNVQTLDKPLHSITTKDRHVLVTLEKRQFVQDHCHTDNYNTLDEPSTPILTRETKQLITISGKNPHTLPTSLPNVPQVPQVPANIKEKLQFITTYFDSKDSSQLITALQNGHIDFDIRMRFLHPEELSQISTFPERYFTDPRLRLTKKEQVKLIGNAVPPQWAKLIIQPVVQQLQAILQTQRAAI